MTTTYYDSRKRSNNKINNNKDNDDVEIIQPKKSCLIETRDVSKQEKTHQSSSITTLPNMYDKFLVENQVFKRIDMDEIDNLLKLVIDPNDRVREELEQNSPRFDKNVNLFSTPKKAIFDIKIDHLYQRQARGDKVCVLNNLYASGNQIVPWLYFYVIYDTTNNDNRIAFYYIKSIKVINDTFEVDLDIHEQKLSYIETMNLTDKLCELPDIS